MVAAGFLAIFLLSQLIKCDGGSGPPSDGYIEARAQQACRDAARDAMPGRGEQFTREQVRKGATAGHLVTYNVTGTISTESATKAYACTAKWDTSRQAIGSVEVQIVG